MNKDIYSKEIEENILGCLIVFKSCRRYIKILEIDDFHININKKIIEIIKDLERQQEPIDLISIKEKAKERKLKEEEIFKYLVKITEVIITSEEIEYHIAKLKNYAIRRKILKTTREINNEMYSLDSDIQADEIKKQCIEKITEIKTTSTELKESDMLSVMTNATENIEKRYQKRDDHTYETGFFELDKATNGLHEQELTIIAARPRNRKNKSSIKYSRKIIS